jgi:hypothetical protein
MELPARHCTLTLLPQRANIMRSWGLEPLQVIEKQQVNP